ncbi:ATP-binding cassette domain-containing protein [Ancylomarina euxinus]|uniref:ATP-binding cassette domain-containing protein n=1 Tax=Ancylomarina euxinus TaxID=2283627 RepID=A0A425XZQ7_9BACT|nr:ATP-binding cassette domain-containing protein [Ancylomarina euxinus]MCZ4695504.1 ATP-binding cassette domain-containing protein [Ancylomarina euxinus]MUP15678.1 ATP-binding cassette domain-containing protein [Ancylomarina euxinus]RRG20671.1 ATP-binding cassette domain-containing protein [Ancylomarina euxinus]
MIELKEVNKSFSDLKVLDDISIQFEAGKTNLIIGQSGSGKTVLLKSIIGLHEVDNGHVYYDDRDFTQMNFNERKLIRKEMGMVFQGGALFDSLSVEENVRFPLDMFSEMNEDEKIGRVKFCLDRVDIKKAHKLYPAEISGGMQKRVAIARAIALNPSYLFCDEPNSGLDPVTAILIDKLIQEITKEFNMTTIINTHDMNSVMEIGEKILFINKGVKAWEGSSEEIFDTENQSLNNFVFASNLFKKIKKEL